MTSSPSSHPPAFMLLFRNAGPATHAHLTAEERVLLMRQWNAWYDGLAREGKVEHGRPLALEGRVVSLNQGRIVDGPYAETKEAVGGYIFLRVASLEEATAIARQCPGLPLGVEVEVRPVAEESPVLEGVHGRPPPAA